MSASPAIRPWPTTASHLVNELQAELQEERRLWNEMEMRHLAQNQAQNQRIEELVGFVSSLGAAMGRSIPASLITPLAQPATPHQSAGASNHVGGSSASQFEESPVSQVVPNQLEGSPVSQIAPN